MYTINDIEDAILATLRGNAILADYVKTFVSLPSLRQEGIKNIIRQFPSIGIISTSGKYEQGIGGMLTETGKFSVICFNRNVRSPEAALRGVDLAAPAADAKGLWDMVEDCRNALLLSDLGLLTEDGTAVIDYCLAVSRRLIYSGDDFSAAEFEIEVSWNNVA